MRHSHIGITSHYKDPAFYNYGCSFLGRLPNTRFPVPHSQFYTASHSKERGKKKKLWERPHLGREIKIFLQSRLNGRIAQRTPYIRKHTDVYTSSQDSNNTSHSTAFLLHKLMWESSVSSSEPHNPGSWNSDKATFFLSTVFMSFSGKQTSFFL